MRLTSDPIDHVLALDLGSRGIARFFIPGAAASAAAALDGARRVVVVTGFSVGPGAPETDGPPGAVVLGHALRLRGARVRYVTDAVNAPVLGAALECLGEPRSVRVCSGAPGAAARMLARESPGHLVSIERPGRTRAGEYLNLRGQPVDQWNVPLDELFLINDGLDLDRAGGAGSRRRASADASASRGRAETEDGTGPGGSGGSRRRFASRVAAAVGAGATARPRATTIGIGDGGNEIGMGNVRGRLIRAGGVLARTASVVRVDHLVVAATSNWGAYGIVAALERLSGRELLHAPAMERRLVEACVAAGAVDGVTKRREPTVDGLPIDAHAAVVELLRLVSRRAAR